MPYPSFTQTWHSAPYEDISPLRPELSVQGRTVVVTGGGTGIGKAIATAFARAGAASVAIIGRREDRLQSAIKDIAETVGDGNDTKLLYQVADLTDKAATTQAFDNIVKHQGGPIDICVSNAGATPKPGLVANTSDEEFFRLINVNVRSTLNTAQVFIPRAAGQATLLNVSTGLVHMMAKPGISTHAVSKAASMKLIEYVQAENPHLHVVSLQPGSVKTEATQNMQGVQSPDDGESFLLYSRILGGVSHAAVANLPGHFCVWLVSEEAKFLKGKYVWANWDVKELMARAGEIETTRLLSIMLEGVAM